MRKEWKNFGDISFLSEGCSMVRPAWDESVLKQHPTLSSCYNVLLLSPIPDKEGYVFTGMKSIDVSNYRNSPHENSIKSFFGHVPEDDNLFAAYCAEYLGIECGVDATYMGGMYPSNDAYIISFDDAKKWLRDLEVPEEWII